MPTPHIIHLAETTSTMDEARQLATALVHDAQQHNDHAAATSLRDGILITAETQTKGRGTHARPWHSPKGTLLGTYLRQLPHAPPNTVIPPLTLRIALGIAQLAEHWLAESRTSPARVNAPNPPITIKWPNDILLRDAKLAGVLIELFPPPTPDTPPTANTPANTTTIALIGVGLNANNPPPDLPPTERPAASLIQHRATPINLTHAAQQLADTLASATDHPSTPLTNQERAALNQRLHAKGEPARLRTTPPTTPPTLPTTAIIHTINPDGSLQLLLPPNQTPHTITRTTDLEWPTPTPPPIR